VHAVLYSGADDDVIRGRLEALSTYPAGGNSAVLGDTCGILLTVEQLGEARRVTEGAKKGPDAAVALIAMHHVPAEIDWLLEFFLPACDEGAAADCPSDKTLRFGEAVGAGDSAECDLNFVRQFALGWQTIARSQGSRFNVSFERMDDGDGEIFA
jgi:hypothetical protein